MSTELNLKEEELQRVQVDISKEEALRLKLRIAQLSIQKGRHYTRKEYLEELIRHDLAKIKGASLREVRKLSRPSTGE